MSDEEAMLAALRRMMISQGGPPATEEPPVEYYDPLLSSFDLKGVAQAILDGTASRIIVMCGAGISVSAGIPDFRFVFTFVCKNNERSPVFGRTPGTGLYDNLQKYDLPNPQAIFDIEYFQERPAAFYQLCKELWPGTYNPTPTHCFIRLLHEKGLLLRCFTQNIDSLETTAGLPKEMCVAAHGNFDSATCIETEEKVPIEEVHEAIMAGAEGWKALQERWGGLVKPDIVFFGENLPLRFFKHAKYDFPQCDLLIVMGTSLAVQVRNLCRFCFCVFYCLLFLLRENFCTVQSTWLTRIEQHIYVDFLAVLYANQRCERLHTEGAGE